MRDYYLFTATLRDLMRPKRVLSAILLIIIPSIIALMLRAGWLHIPFDPSSAYNSLEPLIVFGFSLVILSVIFGTGVVSQDIEQKTVVYMLTRSIPRWRILMVRFFAVMVVVIVPIWLTTAALALCTYGIDGLSEQSVRRDLLILPIGALAYGGLFLLVATILNRSLMWGLLFAFGWESWVPNMSGNFQYFSIMSYLRVLSKHPLAKSETVDVSQLFSMLNPQEITSSLAWHVLIPLIVCSLLLATLVFSLREYVPRDDTA
jgi:ABC-2 type transport system permease protein